MLQYNVFAANHTQQAFFCKAAAIKQCQLRKIDYLILSILLNKILTLIVPQPTQVGFVDTADQDQTAQNNLILD